MVWKRRASSSVAFLVLAASASDAHAADDDLSLDIGAGTLDLRRIPKGTFTQGSPATEPGRETDETPRQVTISRAFWLGKVPVTRAQFTRFVSETRHVTDAEKGQSGGYGFDPKIGVLVQKKDFSWRNPGFPQKDEDPVVLITFGDATAFTAWASRKTGHRVRLPTEAEWEYAARAGTTTPWYGATKEEDVLALGWFKTNSGNSTHSVGLRKPNAFGLFDMAGDVYEWCRDVYAPYPPGDVTDPESSTNPTTEPERRVLRGGSWLKEPKRARSAARHKNTPASRNADNGFRVAVDEDGAIAPQPTGVPAGDFAPTSPLGAASALPGADASPSATALPPRSSEGATWALLAAPIAGAAAATAWVLARRKKTPPNAFGMTTRAEIDGFWVRARGIPAGTRVRYTCIVNGIEVTDVVPLDGGEETFVFTGSPPSAIRVTESAAPEIYRSPQPSVRLSPPTPISVTGPAAQATSLSPRTPISVTGPAAPLSPPTPISVTGPSAPRVPLASDRGSVPSGAHRSVAPLAVAPRRSAPPPPPPSKRPAPPPPIAASTPPLPPLPPAASTPPTPPTAPLPRAASTPPTPPTAPLPRAASTPPTPPTAPLPRAASTPPLPPAASTPASVAPPPPPVAPSPVATASSAPKPPPSVAPPAVAPSPSPPTPPTPPTPLAVAPPPPPSSAPKPPPPPSSAPKPSPTPSSPPKPPATPSSPPKPPATPSSPPKPPATPSSPPKPPTPPALPSAESAPSLATAPPAAPPPADDDPSDP